MILDIDSGKKSHINLRKILRTPAGCLGAPGGTNRGLPNFTGRCPMDLLLLAAEKLTEKGIFAGTFAGCPRDTRLSRVLSETLCDFFFCAFAPGHLRPVILKPVGRIFEISDLKPIRRKRGKCGKSLSPQKNKGLRRFRRAKTRKTRKMRTRKRGKCGKCG